MPWAGQHSRGWRSWCRGVYGSFPLQGSRQQRWLFAEACPGNGLLCLENTHVRVPPSM